MNIVISPYWALNSQAIEGMGDAHLASRLHLRVLPSPRFGLPFSSFIVYRTNFGKLGKNVGVRTDITWIDSQGQVQTPPFAVTPDNPVTGWLPPPSSGVCCWLRVLAEASTNIRVDAVVPSLYGNNGVVCSRDKPPYVVAVSTIPKVVVTGEGVINGVNWIDAKAAHDTEFEFWRFMSLPHGTGPRYFNFSGDPPGEAEMRVALGAPQRFGLHDEPKAANPFAASPATQNDELDRVFGALAPALDVHIDRLINDLSEPWWQLAEKENIFDENGQQIGTADIPCLGTVLNGALDPGIGRWLGFVDVDDKPPSENPEDVIAYFIQGIWQVNSKQFDGEMMDTLPPGALVKEDAQDEFLQAILNEMPEREYPLYQLWTVACATIEVPPLVPDPPQLGGAQLGPWMPVIPPAAEREIVIPASRIAPGATIALARQQGGTIIGLNPLIKDLHPASGNDRAVTVTPAVPQDAVSAGTGEFADRRAPAASVIYRLAQTDWFGRWSQWTQRSAGTIARPNPPKPVLELFYTPPTFAEPIPNTPLSGTFNVRVPVPTPEALAPGSFLLQELRLHVDVGGTVTTTTVPIADANNPPTELAFSVTGPAIDRADFVTTTITANWVDTAGQLSAPSDENVRDLYDPRPPLSITLPNTLQYASRPDVMGQARVGLSWNASPRQKRFRIFYADETILTAKLERLVADGGGTGTTAQQILEAAAATDNAPDRAAVFRNNATFFTRDMFEQITQQPLPSATPGQPTTFGHSLSASLRVLSFYRVVAVSAANVEEPFTEAPLVPYGVPNSSPPAQPFLSATLVTAADGTIIEPYSVRLTISVAAGALPAVEYRLRRSATSSSDALQMPIAGSGPFPAATPGEAQTLEVIDTGVSELDAAGVLQPWTTYYYRVEVRSAAELGGGPTGQWSSPSPAVSLTTMPPHAPTEPINVTVTSTGGSVAVSWEHPDALLGGSLGGYRFDVYRMQPGERESFAGSISADALPANGGRNPDRTGPFTFFEGIVVVPGTRYRILVADPIGRFSPPSVDAFF